MSQNPETRFTNKVRRQIIMQYPEAYLRKHSDKFTHGIPDFEVILPNNPIALDCWFEVKWIPEITKTRKIKYRPLQKHDLEQRAALGVPCGLIVGSPLGTAWYHGSCLPGSAVVGDFWKEPFNIDMFLQAHYGLMAVNKLLPKGDTL